MMPGCTVALRKGPWRIEWINGAVYCMRMSGHGKITRTIPNTSCRGTGSEESTVSRQSIAIFFPDAGPDALRSSGWMDGTLCPEKDSYAFGLVWFLGNKV
jgi:hypothetical protein